ncbi:XF1762 family protein [Amycolatopsis mediterranei]|uniref:XF1762 family protein n=1 Tax=Amycolatopsis mediterranei TaxID=33910 RepID=UPI0034291828
MTLRQASAFVTAHHRHHPAPAGHVCSLGVRREDTGELVGVIVLGRPVARHFDDGVTLEATRSCTNGTPNANSCLYAAAWRAAKALGADRMITYTQDGEPGASLRAAGLRPLARRRPHAGWNRPGRPRMSQHPVGIERTLWVIGADFDAGRHETPDARHKTSQRPRQCQACGAPIEQPATGRVRRTCSNACRARVSRSRRRTRTPFAGG